MERAKVNEQPGEPMYGCEQRTDGDEGEKGPKLQLAGHIFFCVQVKLLRNGGRDHNGPTDWFAGSNEGANDLPLNGRIAIARRADPK